MSPRYFPIEEKDYRLTLGLRALHDHSWLEIDTDYRQNIAEKQRLFEVHPDKVFVASDGTAPGQKAILELVQNELAVRYPEIYLPEAPPAPNSLLTAAMLVQEDLVLMQKNADAYRLTAASVSFPTGWNLEEKLGSSISDIHGPVPDLNPQIGPAIDQFFDRLELGRIVERFNWGLCGSDALFQAGWWRDEQSVDDYISLKNIGDKIFFRVERQTVQRTGNGEDVLFTIRIFNSSLADTAKNPVRATRLLHALNTMPEDMQRYKTISNHKPLIKDYLAAAAN